MTASELLADDRFALLLGARLVEESENRLAVEVEVLDPHLDRSGRISGGVLFALADCALSLISNASATAVAVATHLTRTRSEPVPSYLRAEIHPVTDPSADTVTYRATLTADGTPIAHFTGTTFKL